MGGREDSSSGDEGMVGGEGGNGMGEAASGGEVDGCRVGKAWGYDV